MLFYKEICGLAQYNVLHTLPKKKIFARFVLINFGLFLLPFLIDERIKILISKRSIYTFTNIIKLND